jgi:hypothetical protein
MSAHFGSGGGEVAISAHVGWEGGGQCLTGGEGRERDHSSYS